VAQTLRHNVKAAMQLPMNTMEWAGMVLKSCKLKVGVSSVQTAIIMQALRRCTKKYDANLEANAYDMEPVAKRARKGRKNSAVVTALVIATAGSADGESKQMNELKTASKLAPSASKPSPMFCVMQPLSPTIHCKCTLSGLGIML
jgi:hypothetical protein